MSAEVSIFVLSALIKGGVIGLKEAKFWNCVFWYIDYGCKCFWYISMDYFKSFASEIWLTETTNRI